MGRGMKAGKRPKTGGGKKSQADQIRKVQEMQKQMQQMQEELDEKEIEVTAGGGVVKAKVNGKHELLELTIDQDVVDPDDVDTLQDLVIAAVNEGMRRIDNEANEEYDKLTGGLSVPEL